MSLYGSEISFLTIMLTIAVFLFIHSIVIKIKLQLKLLKCFYNLVEVADVGS